MHEIIVSPFLGNHVVVRPGHRDGVKISHAKYKELVHAVPSDISPAWLAAVARRAWDLDISDEPMSSKILIRSESSFGYGRASYELNLGCNYDCEQGTAASYHTRCRSAVAPAHRRRTDD